MRATMLGNVGAAIALAGLLVGCAHGTPAPTTSPEPEPTLSPAPAAQPLPPGGFDYQLGGGYEPGAGVAIVVRDRTDAASPQHYSICYVNGFQTQPGDLDLWPDAAILRRDGAPVWDPDWPDEALLDTRTEQSRAAITATVAPWIEQCARDGFQAVEFDNLDTYTRSEGVLRRDGNLALARGLVQIAHEHGLAAGQKNAAEDTALLRAEAGFDFAVAEECAVWDECDAYTEVYGEAVLMIEYADDLPQPFDALCRAATYPARVILRDRDLVPAGSPEHVFEACPPRDS